MNPSKQNVSWGLYLSIYFHCILISAKGIILLTPREQSKQGVIGNLYMLVFSHFFYRGVISASKKYFECSLSENLIWYLFCLCILYGWKAHLSASCEISYHIKFIQKLTIKVNYTLK